MNIDAIRTFLVVVQCGNLNRAAELVHVSQSTVTARIDQLEARLGQKLLVRSRKGAELTKAGYAFQRHAEQIVQSWKQGQRRLSLPSGFSGVLAFSCEQDLWSIGEAWLKSVEAEHPDVALEAWPGTAEDASRWLESGLVDIALVSAPLAGRGLEHHWLPSEEIVQVASVERSAATWHEDYVFVDLGPEFRRQHAAAWPGDQTPYRTFGAAVWARDFLLREGGSAYLPWGLVAADVAAKRLFPVKGAVVFERKAAFYWRMASQTAFPWLGAAARNLGPQSFPTHFPPIAS